MSRANWSWDDVERFRKHDPPPPGYEIVWPKGDRLAAKEGPTFMRYDTHYTLSQLFDRWCMGDVHGAGPMIVYAIAEGFAHWRDSARRKAKYARLPAIHAELVYRVLYEALDELQSADPSGTEYTSIGEKVYAYLDRDRLTADFLGHLSYMSRRALGKVKEEDDPGYEVYVRDDEQFSVNYSKDYVEEYAMRVAEEAEREQARDPVETVERRITWAKRLCVANTGPQAALRFDDMLSLLDDMAESVMTLVVLGDAALAREALATWPSPAMIDRIDADGDRLEVRVKMWDHRRDKNPRTPSYLIELLRHLANARVPYSIRYLSPHELTVEVACFVLKGWAELSYATVAQLLAGCGFRKDGGGAYSPNSIGPMATAIAKHIGAPLASPPPPATPATTDHDDDGPSPVV